ncbi:UNVERIFIED_CONTAM: hypothetical protein PYX00_001715 [Menopon gallinae]|uniref:Thioredoxin domain-containing protein 12 n=1 Tax=Menopon gallinae TaxID=328185 RepID=A0AAW2IG25_9NEOP
MRCEKSLNSGVSQMRATRRPGMVVIYKSWCPVCEELKTVFLSSREIDRLNEAEPTDAAFAPDGDYVPRIFFLAPTGQIIYDVVNRQGDGKYKYFYRSAESLIESMNKVMGFFPPDGRH